MPYTDNPLADFNAHMCEQERQLNKLPKCYECGEPITDEFCYEINDECVCEKCLNDNHRKLVEDIVE